MNKQTVAISDEKANEQFTYELCEQRLVSDQLIKFFLQEVLAFRSRGGMRNENLLGEVKEMLIDKEENYKPQQPVKLEQVTAIIERLLVIEHFHQAEITLNNFFNEKEKEIGNTKPVITLDF